MERSNLEVWQENVTVINKSVLRCADQNQRPEPFIKVNIWVEMELGVGGWRH